MTEQSYSHRGNATNSHWLLRFRIWRIILKKKSYLHPASMSFSPHEVSGVFFGVFFLAKVGQPEPTPRTASYFAQNCYSSLPRFVPNRVFRKILGQISWLMPLSGRSWIPARKRTQNSTKSMTTENEGTPADLIRKDFKKKGS